MKKKHALGFLSCAELHRLTEEHKEQMDEGKSGAKRRGSEGNGFNSRLCVSVGVCVCPVACVRPGKQTVLHDQVALPGSEMSQI